MRTMLKVTLVLLVGLSFAFAGNWQYSDAVMNGYSIATDEGEAKVNVPGIRNLYAVGVDGADRVWAGTYYSRRLEDTEGLSDLERYPDLWYEVTEKDTGTGAFLDTVEIWNKPIWIWDPSDGTVDTVRFLVYPGGGQDTIETHRGFTVSYDGNMLAALNNDIYKINYQTYEVMAHWESPDGFALQSLASDENGYAYVCDLWGGTVYVLDPDDLTEYTTVTDGAGSTRGSTVSSDGTVYYATNGLSGDGVSRFYSADGPDGTYALVDTVGEDVIPSGTAAFQPVADHLWLISCVDNQSRTWSFDPANDYAYVDTTSFGYNTAADTTIFGYSSPDLLRCPRDYAFNAAGTKFYFAEFYGYTIKEWTYVESAVDDASVQPAAFRLSQNYPNPFNPSTVIPFELSVDGMVKLTVYDVTGRQVASLVNQHMKAGSHNATFNGSGFASGPYFYELVVDGQKEVHKMMLVK